MARYTPRISRGAGGGGPTPPGTGGVGYQFVFNPNAAQNPAINLYSSWIDLINAINPPNLPLTAPPSITFELVPGVPFIVPAGTWNMNGAELRSSNPATGQTVVSVPDGVTLDNVAKIDEGLVVVGAPTVDGTTFTFSYAAPGTVSVLSVGLGAAIINQTPNKSALILTPGPAPGPNPTIFVLSSILAQYGSVAPSTGPFVRETPGDVVIANVIAGSPAGQFPDEWIAGIVGSSLIYQLGLDAVAPKTTGYLGTIFPLNTVQDTTAPLAIKGALRQLIFTDVAPGPGDYDTFSIWDDLYAILKLLDLPVRIVFRQSDPNTPLHIPAGTWIMGEGVSWASDGIVNGGAEVILDDQCVIQDLHVIEEGVAVVGNSTSPSLTFSGPFIPGNPIVMALGIASVLANFGASPLIQQSSADLLIIGMLPTSNITNTGGGAPVIDITPSGAFVSTVFFYMVGGSIDSNTISGANAGGTATAGFQVTTDESIVSLNQPAWTGLPLSTTAFTVQQRPRVNIQTSPLASGSTYNVLNGSEFVRCAPTGLGDISVVLPDPTLEPDQTVLVKKTTADVIDNINVSAAGGSTIDGLAVYPLPLTPYSVLRFTSDGTNWWVT